MAESRLPEQARIYNLVTAIMLILTFAVCVIVTFLALTNDNPPPSVANVPTAYVLSTATATLPGPTVNPTWTLTPTATITGTPTPTRTPTPTFTPTPTNTPTPTDTPTITPTRTPSNTPRPTNTGEAQPTNPPGGFTFEQRGQTNFTSNPHESCDWAGITGAVFDNADPANPVSGIRIRVTGPGVDQTVTSGSAPNFGTSGWEVKLDNEPIAKTFKVWVVSSSGDQLSEKVTVETKDNCDRNMAVVNFRQK